MAVDLLASANPQQSQITCGAFSLLQYLTSIKIVVTADFYQPQQATEHGDDQIRIAGDKGGGGVEVKK